MHGMSLPLDSRWRAAHAAGMTENNGAGRNDGCKYRRLRVVSVKYQRESSAELKPAMVIGSVKRLSARQRGVGAAAEQLWAP